WFALRDTRLFRFRIPGGQHAGPNARAALGRIDFNLAVGISPEGVVPGDRIIGILRPEGPLMVYPIHSDALVAMHDSDVAWIDVRWDASEMHGQLFRAAISMLSVNRPGSMAQISSAIAACEANIHNLFMRMISPDFHHLVFQIEVKDLPQLS